MRAVLGLAMLAGLAACTPERSLPVGPGPNLPAPVETPTEAPPTAPDSLGPGAGVVRRIASDVEARYQVVVWRAEIQDAGRLVVYAVRLGLDERSQHPNFDDWNAHVRRAARNQRAAAVSMLRSTIMALPRVQLVSVYQDELLQPFWSRRQIEAMGRPARYRSFTAWEQLVLSAAVLPGRPGP
ncbi:MAG: hypothetical protein ACRDHB_08365 [Actinomycetota bacterium]